MKNLIDQILKQYDLGPWWGALKSTIGSASLYLTIFNTAMIAPMAYVTWASPWLLQMGIAMPFWMFGVVILIGIFVVLLFEYKLSTPSNFIFWNAQFWKHDNPIKAKMEEHDKRFDEQGKRLKKIEDILNRIESK
jgi:hypothetical protein